MLTLSQPASTCSKLTIKTLERRQRRSCVFIVNFEYVSHLVLVYLLLTLRREMPTWIIPSIHKMVRDTLKTLQHFLQDF